MVPIFSQNLKNCNFERGFHGNEKKYEKTKCTFNTQFLGLLTNFMVVFRSVTMSAHIFLVFILNRSFLYEILERISPVKGAKLRRNQCFPGVIEA